MCLVSFALVLLPLLLANYDICYDGMRFVILWIYDIFVCVSFIMLSTKNKKRSESGFLGVENMLSKSMFKVYYLYNHDYFNFDQKIVIKELQFTFSNPVIMFVFKGIDSKKTEFHLANRLDRDTSGVILVTKSHKVAAKLVKAFTDHKVRKTYIALCVGQAPKWKKAIIKSGHGRSKFGAWRVYATKDVGRTLPGGSSIREMETLFEVISINGDQCNQELNEIDIVVEEKSSIECDGNKVEVLVRAYPRSGRTHQIRLHCQYLGIPIRGDVKYEGVYEWNGILYDGHQLHAESLSFEHPVTGSPIVINAPLPLWATQGL